MLVADIFVMADGVGMDSCAGTPPVLHVTVAAAAAGYQAHPPDCPLNIRNLS